MNMLKLMALVLALHGCGLSSHGGIIDNGNQPDDEGAGPQPDLGEPVAPTTPVTVLADFVVDVPADAAAEAALLESNVVSFDDNVIMFAPATAPCAATSIATSAGATAFFCSDRKTILRLGEGPYIAAKHTERNEAINSVLFSFRRK